MRKETSAKPGRTDEEALENLKQRFEGWRRGRERRSGIPPILLKAAKGLVGPYRPATLAKALRLHYRHVGGAEGFPVVAADKRPRRKSDDVQKAAPRIVPTFVRVPLESPRPTLGSGRPGMVEFENPRGFKARVFLGDDPTGLVRELLKAISGESR